jgi:hypothetical protein
MLTCRNDYAQYRIECPPGCEVRLNEDGTDFLVVPDPDDVVIPYIVLWDDILLEAAVSGEFGLKMVSIEPTN